MREIRLLRAMRRALETGLRKLLTGHEGGNAGYRQGGPFESPRQCSTLPSSKSLLIRSACSISIPVSPQYLARDEGDKCASEEVN